MATDASQLSFEAIIPHQTGQARTRRPWTFAGLTPPQMLVGLLVLAASIWAMWTTREVMHLRAQKVVSVRLGELVNQFALAEARSGDDPDKVSTRTRAFMEALDKALKVRSANGAVVLVGEAIVASSSEDITAVVAADVARTVPMPVAQAMPPRLSVAPAASASGSAEGGVAQAMLGAFGSVGSPGAAPSGDGVPQARLDQQGVGGSPAYPGGGDVQR